MSGFVVTGILVGSLSGTLNRTYLCWCNWSIPHIPPIGGRMLQPTPTLHIDPIAISRVLVFEVGDQAFAVRIGDVAEIIPMAALSCPSSSPSVLIGFLNVEGVAVPVLNVARLVNVPDVKAGLYTPVILMRRGEERFGLLVSTVRQIALVPSGSVIAMRAHGLLTAAVKLGEQIVPVVSIADLVLKQERERIDELRGMQQQRLAKLEEAIP